MSEQQVIKMRRSWLTPTVHHLAQAIYEDRDWDALPVLADALEEAGCRDEPCPKCMPNFDTKNGYGLGWVQEHDSSGYFNIGCENCGGKGLIDHGGTIGTGRIFHPLLAHLRGPGPHARGCWALDLILGKE